MLVWHAAEGFALLFLLCVCVCICVRQNTGNWKVPGLMPSWSCCFLEQETWFSIPSYIMETCSWWPGVNWGSTQPRCNINGYPELWVVGTWCSLGEQMFNCPLDRT